MTPARCRVVVAGAVEEWALLRAGIEAEDDLQRALREDGIAGVIVARAEQPAAVAELAAMVGRRPLQIAASIDTAVGLLNAGAMAAVERLSRFVLGEAELRADLGLATDGNPPGMDSTRGHLVVISAAFGKEPPIAGAPLPGEDVGETSERLRAAGYAGRLIVTDEHAGFARSAFGSRPAGG